jgi:MFS family permease
VGWSQAEVGWLHTAGSAGLLLPLFITQWLVERFGAKRLIGGGLLVSVGCALAMPAVVFLLTDHFLPQVAIRFLLGLGQGIYQKKNLIFGYNRPFYNYFINGKFICSYFK